MSDEFKEVKYFEEMEGLKSLKAVKYFKEIKGVKSLHLKAQVYLEPQRASVMKIFLSDLSTLKNHKP